MKKGKGKITSKKSGNSRYESVWLYIPSKLVKDSSFPFIDKEEVSIEIENEKLIVSKIDELIKIIEDYGIENATINKLIIDKSIENKNKPFIYYKNQTVTYKELNEKSNQIAHGIYNLIKKLKLKRPKISLIFPNCPDFIFCWIGIIKAGGIFSPIDITYQGEELEYLLKHNDTKILIIDYSNFENFKEISHNLPKIQKVVIRNAPKNFTFNEKYLDFDEIISTNIENLKLNIKNWHPMEIIYTSGTTGAPKAVIYRNHHLLTGLNIGKEYEQLGFHQSHILYCPLPLSHAISQLLIVLPAIFYNASVVIAEKFDVSTFWDDIFKYKVTQIFYTQMMLRMLIKQPYNEKENSHSVNWAFGFGASKEVWEIFEKRFNITLYEGWSLTEITGITINKIGSKGGKIGSIGKSVSGYELKIVDPKGNVLPLGSENVGEIVSRCKLPFKIDYYKEQKQGITRMKEDKWVYSGDYGYRDSDGYLYFLGRKSDIIKNNDKNIYLNEIEIVTIKHPYILESAAIEIQYENASKIELKLCVVLKENVILTHEELHEFLMQNMAFDLVPRYIQFYKELPKTSTHFIKKFELIKESKEKLNKKITWDAKKKKIST
jgi:crotonobetaine/carnitine-CoA ligase